MERGQLKNTSEEHRLEQWLPGKFIELILKATEMTIIRWDSLNYTDQISRVHKRIERISVHNVKGRTNTHAHTHLHFPLAICVLYRLVFHLLSQCKILQGETSVCICLHEAWVYILYGFIRLQEQKKIVNLSFFSFSFNVIGILQRWKAKITVLEKKTPI